MAEKTELQSLANLVSAKGAANREMSDSRFKVAKNGASSSSLSGSKRGGFNGLLNSFMGGGKASGTRNDKTAGTGSLAERLDAGKAAKPQTGSKKSRAGGPGSKLAAEDKRSLRRSMEKTVADDQAPADDAYGPEVAAAAEEAAMLIMGLLFGPAATAERDGGALAWLSGKLSGGSGGLAGLGTEGAVDLAAMQAAIETANASAEMNSAAVLAALDEMLDGMPRGALEEALAALTESMGMPGDGNVFNLVAAALEAEVTDVGGGEAELLAFLRGSAVHSGSDNQKIAPDAAENSGDIGNLMELFAEFVTETGLESSGESPSAKKGERIFENFSAWLQATGKDSEAKELASRRNGFVQALIDGMPAGGTASAGRSGAGGEVFYWVRSNLEIFLQSIPSTRPEESALALEDGDAAMHAGQRGMQGGLLQGSGCSAQAIPSAAQHGTANPAAMSTMLDQIENIERLAEAMKMAARGGMKHLTLQLSPPELGKVMLRVESHAGVVSAYLRVEKAEAAAQLGANLQQLREQLKAQGVELSELNIAQRGDHEALGDFSGQRQGGRGREADDAGNSRGREGGAKGGSAEVEADPPSAPSSGGPGALNLFA